MTMHYADFSATSELLVMELHEQRDIYRALSRSISELERRGEQPQQHLLSMHRTLSDHFTALSQGR